MSGRVRIVLVGIGGYGNYYVNALLGEEFRESAEIVGAVEPHPERCRRLEELLAIKVPVFPTLDEFYESAPEPPELAVISSPIHYHAPQTVAALSGGSNVLCEKPMCATVQEAEAMKDARDRSGNFVSIGFQRSFWQPARIEVTALVRVLGPDGVLRTEELRKTATKDKSKAVAADEWLKAPPREDRRTRDGKLIESRFFALGEGVGDGDGVLFAAVKDEEGVWVGGGILADADAGHSPSSVTTRR